MGYGNNVKNTSSYCSNNVLLGSDNSMLSNGGNAQYNVLIGRSNSIGNRKIGAVLCGNNLSTNTSMVLNSCVYGTLNSNFTSLADCVVVIGCGQNNTKKTAIEITYTQCKIRNNLQLEYDTTEVNAITPPQDPDNVTQDDQTLVTKSYLQTFAQYSLINSWDLSTAPVLPLDGTSYTLTDLPATAKQYLFVFRWGNQVYYNVVTPSDNSIMQLDHNRRAFSTFSEIIEYQQLRVDWDATHQTITAVDYYFYNQDMANAGAISQWDHTLTNAGDCKVLAVLALL